MRHLLLLLICYAPYICAGQLSWVNVSVQADQYGGETSWEIVQGDSVFASIPSYGTYEYAETLVTLPAGEYDFIIYDSFGDGICCGFGEGYFSLYNMCGVDTAVYDFAGSSLTIPINLLPCPPPPAGCSDPEAVNYVPNAVIDQTCVYPVTFRLDLNGPHPESIDIPEVNSQVNGWCGSCWAMADDDGDGVWEITVPMPEGVHLWKFSADNWEVQELPVGVLDSPCFLFDANGYVNRSIIVDGPVELPPFCWESCLPCGGVPGCTDPNALNYNPWATFDVGCILLDDANCGDDEVQVTVTVVLDNYPGETSWILLNEGDTLYQVSPGEYINDDPGVPLHENVCAAANTEVTLLLDDSFGDGLNGAQWGGIDGNVVIAACGEPLWALEDPNFGYGIDVVVVVEECQVASGCTDPLFVEYDANAVEDDGSCLTEVIYGCTDSLALNYNVDANALETEESCDFTLTLLDGVGDGWFGSWLGVIQGDEIFGPFEMGPQDGIEESFSITLHSGEQVEVLFFTSGNAETTAAQCGFFIEGPQGVCVEGGTNPWTDAIKKFPYRYTGVPLCDDFCIEAVLGCTDSEACNYNAQANVEGDCTFPIEYYNCANECILDSDEDGVCDELEVTGCMDPTAFNYNELATDPGDCDPFIFGCTDPTMFNFDPSANTDNGGCIPVILGCTDSLAFNYDPDANTDSGGCIEVVAGCMDVDAYNFNILANVANNGTCLYEAVGCVTGLGEPYGNGFWLNDSCFAWVIEVDPYCCNTDWDSSCQELHSYCEAGWPTDVTEINHTIRVYPNPVRDELNISCANLQKVTAWNMQGQQVYDGTTSSINTGSWPAGIYNLQVYAYLRTYNIKIVKQ